MFLKIINNGGRKFLVFPCSPNNVYVSHKVTHDSIGNILLEEHSFEQTY